MRDFWVSSSEGGRGGGDGVCKGREGTMGSIRAMGALRCGGVDADEAERGGVDGGVEVEDGCGPDSSDMREEDEELDDTGIMRTTSALSPCVIESSRTGLVFRGRF